VLSLMMGVGAISQTTQHWMHVLPDGEPAGAGRFDFCGNYQDGRCVVRDFEHRYFHLRRDGEPAYPDRYAYAGDFRDGVAVVQSRDGRHTHIDRDGRLVHGRWFADLDVFHKGYARARDGAGWHHVDQDGAPRYARRFARWEFRRGDFASLTLEPGDFVYADPPYDVEFTSYSQGGFPWKDQVRTAEWLATHEGPVILVNQATEKIRRLYRSLGYRERLLQAPRRINSTGDRTPAMEIFATRNL